MPRKPTPLDRVRRLCLAFPGAEEKLSHGSPTFFTPKRVFASSADSHHGDGHIAVWPPAAPGVQESLVEEDSATYYVPPYVGCRGWVAVELTRVDDEQLGALIREAHAFIESKHRKTPARPLTRRSKL